MTPGSAIAPAYLGAQDYPWLRALLDEHARFAGRPRRLLAQQLTLPLPRPAPPTKLRLVCRVLDSLPTQRPPPSVKPRLVRAALFEAATTRRCEPPDVVRRDVARLLELAPTSVDDALFADMPGERPLAPATIGPVELALRANLAMVQAALRRAWAVRVELWGRATAVVRVARLRGLLCVVSPIDGDPPGARLDVSGPLALFRRTTLYGHALASLVPALTWCDRFHLRAAVGDGHVGRWLEVHSGDPLWLPAEARRFDSALEERFAADFARVAPDWDVVREPAPVNAGSTLLFPDFALVHRRDPSRRWLLEVVGFWTPEYLSRKLARLRQAGLSRLIVCVDAARACGAADLPADAAIVRYRRHIDPREVLRIAEGS